MQKRVPPLENECDRLGQQGADPIHETGYDIAIELTMVGTDDDVHRLACNDFAVHDERTGRYRSEAHDYGLGRPDKRHRQFAPESTKVRNGCGATSEVFAAETIVASTLHELIDRKTCLGKVNGFNVSDHRIDAFAWGKSCSAWPTAATKNESGVRRSYSARPVVFIRARRLSRGSASISSTEWI